MIDENHIFRSGKYAGKTIAQVKKTEPSYIRWVEENKPQMLKPTINYKQAPNKPNEPTPRKEPPPDDKVVVKTTLQENTYFLKQGPKDL